MKTFITSILVLGSVQAFAVSTVTTKVDLTLSVRSEEKLYSFNTKSKGSDSCSVDLVASKSEDTYTVPAGTVFELNEYVYNDCGYDWGRVCSYTATAKNLEHDVSLILVCKDKGTFAQKITPKKIRKFVGDLITLE